MKEFPITLNFDHIRVVGHIQLSAYAVGLLKNYPEHCITFSYNGEGSVNLETNEPLEPWEVCGAALIPNSSLPEGNYKDLHQRGS